MRRGDADIRRRRRLIIISQGCWSACVAGVGSWDGDGGCRVKRRNARKLLHHDCEKLHEELDVPHFR
jgi:hypothetical protein